MAFGGQLGVTGVGVPDGLKCSRRCRLGIALFTRVSEAKTLGPTARSVTGRLGYGLDGFEVISCWNWGTVAGLEALAGFEVRRSVSWRLMFMYSFITGYLQSPLGQPLCSSV